MINVRYSAIAIGTSGADPGAPHRRGRIAFWFLVYSGLAITAAFFLAATWGAGQSVMPLSGAPRGTAVQEASITAVSYSSAPTGIIAFALILWGPQARSLGRRAGLIGLREERWMTTSAFTTTQRQVEEGMQ